MTCRPRTKNLGISIEPAIADPEVRQTIAEAMHKAEIDDAMVYAFLKTGRLLLADREDVKYPPEVLAEWDAAIAEYEAGQLVETAGGGR
jgi:hypothetical protein